MTLFNILRLYVLLPSNVIEKLEHVLGQNAHHKGTLIYCTVSGDVRVNIHCGQEDEHDEDENDAYDIECPTATTPTDAILSTTEAHQTSQSESKYACVYIPVGIHQVLQILKSICMVIFQVALD